MGNDILQLHLRNLGPGIGDTGIGDDDVNVVNPLFALESFDGIEGVLPDAGIDLNDDELRASRRREVEEVC